MGPAQGRSRSLLGDRHWISTPPPLLLCQRCPGGASAEKLRSHALGLVGLSNKIFMLQGMCVRFEMYDRTSVVSIKVN